MIAVLFAGAFGVLFTLLLTPFFIRLFVRLGWGQFIREDGPKSHSVKRGTPTMGGVVFCLSTLVSYLLAAITVGGGVAYSALLVLFMMLGTAMVGFVDDYTKVKKQRSLGIGGWTKVVALFAVATVFGIFAFTLSDRNGVPLASRAISFTGESVVSFEGLLHWGLIGIILVWILSLLWVGLTTVAAANAVNLTDGLDGLAAGAAGLVLAAYVIIGFWQFNQSCSRPESLHLENIHRCYQVSDPLDYAVVAAALCGSLMGFLWWNTNPAKIIMGDTGALGLGGAIAALAILSRTEILLVILGGLFVIETLSVIIQRAVYKKFRRRVFLMSPIHHHFELKGWPEVTVVVRFWIVAIFFISAGLGIFYLQWLYS